MKTTITFLICITILLLSLFLLKKPSAIVTPQKYKVVQLKSDTVFSTKEITVSKLNLKFIHDTIILPVNKIDTVAIISDYYDRKIYSDTSVLQNNLIVVNDTIDRNEIIGRSIYCKSTNELIADSIFLAKKEKVNLYIGGNYRAINKAIGIQMNLQYKRVDVGIGYNTGLLIGFSYKIKK